VIGVTKAALDRQQQLVIANSRGPLQPRRSATEKWDMAPVSICARIFSQRSQIMAAQPKCDTRLQ